MADRQLEQITNSAGKVYRYGKDDPETALQHARKAAEAICRDVYEKEYGEEPRGLRFGQMIHALSKERAILPNLVTYSLRNIQNFGGINAHEDMAPYLRPVLEFFPAIVAWYFEKYLKRDIPGEIKGEPENGLGVGESVAQLVDPVVAICINGSYDDPQNGRDTYKCTRGTWKVNKARAEKARYALAVHRGKILEVYEIDRWLPAGSTEGSFGPAPGRHEFVGQKAPGEIRSKYVGKRLPDRFYGFPIRYYNC